MYLQKYLKNTYPIVWQLSFAILLTWQIEEKDSHICQTSPCLASRASREIRRPLGLVAWLLLPLAIKFSYEDWRRYCDSVPSTLAITLHQSEVLPRRDRGGHDLAGPPRLHAEGSDQDGDDRATDERRYDPRRRCKEIWHGECSRARRKCREDWPSARGGKKFGKKIYGSIIFFAKWLILNHWRLSFFLSLLYLFRTWQNSSFAKRIMQNRWDAHRLGR